MDLGGEDVIVVDEGDRRGEAGPLPDKKARVDVEASAGPSG